MDPSDTKNRIIEAAIEAFLEKGYAAATIRGICSRAKTNLAAVNYHFGSKDLLYAAAFERIVASCQASCPVEASFAESASPQERLRFFIHNVLRLVFPENRESANRSKLLWMKLGHPNQAQMPQVEHFMRPIIDTLQSIVVELTGRSESATIQLCIGSIVGQQFFHAQNRFFITQLSPGQTYLPQDVNRLAEHVYRFSLAGLEAVRATNDKYAG